MSREILFRGKSVETGKFVEGYYMVVNDVHIIWFIGESRAVSVHPPTVGQFTGLCDKNGAKVFEGDVVSVDCSGVGGAFYDGIYIVEYTLPDCSFYLTQIDAMSAISFNECYVYEIIGNIHEKEQSCK
jgi:uncharacterized phage protein (TIGR01671 family)